MVEIFEAIGVVKEFGKNVSLVDVGFSGEVAVWKFLIGVRCKKDGLERGRELFRVKEFFSVSFLVF